MTNTQKTLRFLAIVAGVVTHFSAPSFAYSLSHKTTNLETSTWVEEGEIMLPYTHRFRVNSGKVTNSPTFAVQGSLFKTQGLGLRYASASDINFQFNELELFHRFPLFETSPLGGIVQWDYNLAANSVDAVWLKEIKWGKFDLLLQPKVLSSLYGSGSVSAAAGAGVLYHLTPYLTAGADINSVLLTQDRARFTEPLRPAYSVNLILDIPYSPHSVDLYFTNTNTQTLQGSLRGGEDLRFGFDWMMPMINLSEFAETSVPVEEKQ
jgi:hypothetical protein